MKDVLAPGTMKNYYTTAAYLKEFVQHQYKRSDIFLSELDYGFITKLEHFSRKRVPEDHQKKLEVTNPTTSLEMGRSTVLKSTQEVFQEERNNKGGRKISKTTAGSSLTVGSPGMKPIARSANTSRIG